MHGAAEIVEYAVPRDASVPGVAAVGIAERHQVAAADARGPFGLEHVV